MKISLKKFYKINKLGGLDLRSDNAAIEVGQKIANITEFLIKNKKDVKNIEKLKTLKFIVNYYFSADKFLYDIYDGGMITLYTLSLKGPIPEEILNAIDHLNDKALDQKAFELKKIQELDKLKEKQAKEKIKLSKEKIEDLTDILNK